MDLKSGGETGSRGLLAWHGRTTDMPLIDTISMIPRVTEFGEHHSMPLHSPGPYVIVESFFGWR